MSAAVSFDPLQAQAYRSLEWRLTDPLAFGLTTASPLQRAICRVIDGKPLRELARDPVVLRALGGTIPTPVPPLESVILAGIRAGKSLLVSCLAVHWSQRCDVSRLGPGEVPRISVVSPRKDLSRVIYEHIVGRLTESPILRHLLIGEPTTDTIYLRHPTGRPVEIKVVAGSKAGSTLTARWMAGVIFDEFARMQGERDGVINWDAQRRATLERILPGGGMAHISSPMGPDGPAYELVTQHLGKPSKAIVVFKAPGADMNPIWWTPQRVEDARLKDPDVFRTDVMAEFGTPEESLYSADLITKSIRPESGPEPGCSYIAAMDPATRGNGWTLGIFTRQGKRKRMVLAREWVGSHAQPLSPREVLKEIAAVVRPYTILRIETDRYYVDALQDLARENGLTLQQVNVNDRERTERYLGIKAKLAENEIELVPEVRADMLRLRKKVTHAGVSVVLPLTSDGRHCDYAPVVMLGLGRWLKDENAEEKAGYVKPDPEVQRMLESATRRFARPKDDWGDD